ncbi:hypothetical protein MLD38_025322 [Melastoma candidum]|uniref:Uncharacterized protein n=1 Tax=Melastoma candidum TaxID=119954 RepID=A0ACB9NYI3_9MYRT|nr:hypothetical protein MLD38_025322 [Melastoma candidum]
MKQYTRRRARDKFDDTDDWCFVCKDGGDLVLCDHKDCLKVYHPECVGRDDSSVQNGLFWTCGRHSCFLCQRVTKFYCFCCPNSICGHCDSAAHFVVVQGDGGLCDHCLSVILLIEKNVDCDLDGQKIDFGDRNTIECLFKEYWEIIKERFGLTTDHVYSAQIRMKGKWFWDADFHISGSKFREETDWESDSKEEVLQKKRLRKARSSSGIEFEGWGSKALIQFLISVGKDTSKPLSRVDVFSVISKYISDKNLLHPEKKKRVVFDKLLYSVFGRKSANKHKLYFLLEPHLKETLGLSDESESDNGSETRLEPENKSISCPIEWTVSNSEKPTTKELEPEVRETGYACISEANIKLIYLKKSMIEELLKQPESFEGKIVGSFIKVKTYEGIYFPNCFYQLLQVTGVKRLPLSDGMKNDIILQGYGFPSDITISMLSDSDFSKEECDQLRQPNANLSRKLTVVEVREKAISLHADLTKHWINGELNRLDRLIEQANEKGAETLFQYLEQRSLLKKPSEQERLLKRTPKVIPETITIP